MPRILIAGCGYVGEAAADFFHDHGWEVEGWTASAQSADRLTAKPYHVRAVDIADAGAMSGVRESFDVVLQSVSTRGGDGEDYRRVYFEGAQGLLRVFAGATHLFASSTSVYAQQGGEMVDETSPSNPSHEKGRILRETEERVLARNGIVVRLAGIYGPGRSYLFQTILAGNGSIDIENDRFINQAHRDDIVAALFLLAERRGEIGGQIYNVVDNQPFPASSATRWLAARLGRSLRTGGSASSGRRGITNKRVSNAKLRGLGWEPIYPNFEAGMIRSVLPSFGIEPEPKK